MKGGCEEVCEEGREDGKTGSTHLQLGRDINRVVHCSPKQQYNSDQSTDYSFFKE
jgi:hypothetical protein